MKAFSIFLIAVFSLGVAYVIPVFIEHQQKQNVTVTGDHNDRGSGRGIVISVPPPK